MDNNTGRGKQLLKNTFVLTLGNILPKVTNLVTLPVLTAYLTKAEYGTYDLIITLVSLLLPAATLQIQSAAFRFLVEHREDENEQKNVVSNIFVVVLPISIIVLLSMFFVMAKYDPMFRLLLVVYYFLDIILLVAQQVARGLGKNLLYSISAIVNAIVTMIIVFIALVICDAGINGALVALAVAAMTSTAVLVKKIHLVKLIDRSKVSGETIRRLLSYSWPMIPNNLSGWVLNLSDRLVITAVLGVEANAVYAVANKLPNLLLAFNSTFSAAWQENATIAMNDDDKDAYYTNMFNGVMRLVLGMTAMLIAGTPILFTILIQGDYAEAYNQMPILYFGMLFCCMATMIGGIYIAHMKTKSVGITTFLAAVCNFLIDICMIKFIGIYAGSVSTCVSYFILLVYRFADVQKFQKIRFDFKLFATGVVLLVIMSFICLAKTIPLDLLNIVIAVVFALVLNREIVSGMLSKVKKGI